MKKLLIAFLLLAGLSMNGQTITNPGFENWTTTSSYITDTLPTNWWSFFCNTVKQTTDACQGMYATKIQGMFSCGIAPGIMVNGQAPTNYGSFMESGTPFTSKPSTFSGYYKYNDQGTGDSAEVTVVLKRYNSTLMQRDTVAYSVKTLPATASYTLFTVNIDDLMPGVSPDSIIIMFNSSKHYMWNDSTWELPILYVDRINMAETPMSITENGNLLFQSFVYPNPFSETAKLSIDATLSELESAILTIFDLNGKKVMDYGSITSNKLQIHQQNLSKGSYFYQITAKNEFISRGKFIVQ